MGAALLLALVFIAYLPAIFGGFIWDDPQYILNNLTLRTLHGLNEIWFHPSKTPQYYPLVHTTFWIEFHLWQLAPAGYHIDNVLIHAASAFVLWRLLRRLNVNGCFLAAAIFAVHPVLVESVAWITERKNVLSALLYLLAMYFYVTPLLEPRAKPSRETSEPAAAPSRPPIKAYVLSLLLFAGALLSKSVTCSLPAAILLILWWKRGRLRWRDILPLVPFFLVGLAASYNTAHLEREHVGAVGREWDISFLDRFLIACRALWFYVGKILWPTRLTFVYPRWPLPHNAIWWIWPVLTAATLLALWLLRRRLGRGPLAAALFFGGTLLPALGFVNIFPMRYTFVADHYVYLASLGIIIPAAALIRRLPRRREISIGVVAVLGVLTFLRSRVYASPETLWTDTLAKNPNSWMVHMNLGNAYQSEGRLPDALRQFTISRDLAPEFAETHWKLGAGYFAANRPDDAIAEFKAAIRADPNDGEASFDLGNVYMSQGKLDEAIKAYETAKALDPSHPDPDDRLGLIAESEHRWSDAEAAFRRAIAIDGSFSQARVHLGVLLFQRGDFKSAAEQFSAALQDDPNQPDVQANLGLALLKQGDAAGADAHFRAALQQDPTSILARRGLEAAHRQAR